MNKPNAPCLNCENRQVNCHSSCSLYLLYYDNLVKYNNEIRKLKDIEYDYIGYSDNKNRKLKKWT